MTRRALFSLWAGTANVFGAAFAAAFCSFFFSATFCKPGYILLRESPYVSLVERVGSLLLPVALDENLRV